MKLSKAIVLTLTFACALSVSAQSSVGGAPQPGAPAAGGGPGGGAFGGDTVDDQLKNLTTQLALTEAQQPVARAILEEKQKLVLGVREKFPVAKPGSPPSQEGIEAMTKAMKSVHVKMLAILNDDQKKKYDAIDATEPGQGPGAGPGPGPEHDKK
jgi:hypothetical protein